MIRIAICDDEVVFREQLSRIISSYFDDKHIEYSIDTYSSGVEFNNLKDKMLEYQIVFLDINMDGMDGIETARHLRKICRDTYVIFVTAFIKYTLEGYKVDATRYILKKASNLEDAVYESLDAIMDKMNYNGILHSFRFKDGELKVNMRDIVYIESRLHELTFYLMENDITRHNMDATLNNVEKEYNDGRLVRIHQSILVNMDYIQKIKSQEVILKDGTVLAISRSRYKEVREKYAGYKGAF